MKILLRLLLLVCSSALAERPALEEFVHRARSQRLDTLPGWIALGRWEGARGKWHGAIDGGYFYLDSLGRNHPDRELEATIRALASVPDLSPFARDTTALRLHPRAKYRARTRFLLEHGMPDSLLAAVDTSRWRRWHEGVRPRKATLVYASSYLGNPASMFGHVLLRFDAQDRTGLKDRLNYGITYGAGMPPGDPLYIPKGLFGLYPGFLSILPYYLTLQKYKYLESRDLWEYPMDLDSTQIERLLEMVWEGGAGWNRYYFFTENCATGLARLLDVLQPDSAWAERFPSPSMPPELVRLFRDRGLAGAPVRRPSQLAVFLERRDALTIPQRQSLRRIVDGDLSDTARWNDLEAPRILDAGIDYLGWQRRNHPRDSLWRLRQESLLERRARLPVGPTEVVVSDQGILPPETGHRPRLLGFEAGRRTDGSPELGFLGRVTYHALEERPDGFLDGSEVVAGTLDARWAPREGLDGIRLANFDVLRIRSVPLWDSWLRSWAWSIRLGARPFGFQDDPWISAEGSRGLATGTRAVRLWGMVGARAALAPWETLGSATAGPQVAGGLLLTSTPCTFGLEADWFEGWPVRKRERLLSATVRMSPVRDLDLQARGAVDPDRRIEARVGASWHL